MSQESRNSERSTASTDVLVLATGLVKADRYVTSYRRIIDHIEDAVDGIEAMLKTDVGTLHVRGSSKLEEMLAETVDMEVTDAFFPWIGFVNDDAEHENGEVVVDPVKQPDEEEMDVDSARPSEVRDQISAGRERRAKAKAGAKMNHFLFSEYYDDFPNVEAVITVHDGSNRGISEFLDTRGVNSWVNGKAGHVKQTIDLNVQDQLLYARAMLDDNPEMSVADLSQSQRAELREHLSSQELADYGVAGESRHNAGGGTVSGH
jgi:hypothetical protein